MIFNLINKLNKSNYKYKTYVTDGLNRTVFDNTLSSSLLGDGGVSLKIVINNKKIMQYITLPNQIHCNAKRVEEISIPSVNRAYQITLQTNNFFTLNILSKNHIEDVLSAIVDVTGGDEHLIFNLIIKPKYKLLKLFTNQYEMFCNGVNNPSSNKFIKTLQENLIEKNHQYLPIEVMDIIENKIYDKHFEFQLFFGMYYNSPKKENLIFDILKDVFDNFSHLNSLNVNLIHSHIDVALSSHELLHQYEKQFISLSELYALFYNNKIEDEDFIENSNEYTIVNELNNLSNTDQSNSILNMETNNNHNNLTTESTFTINTLSSLEMLPTQIETNEDDVDRNIPKRIEDALKRVKIILFKEKVEIIDFRIGASLIKTTITIPENKTLTDITKRVVDIRAALGVDSLSIDQGEKPNSVSFFIPRTNKQPIYLRSLLENEEFIKFAEEHPLPIIIGVDPLGNPIYACINKLTHLLIAGQTNSGKSSFINQLLLTLIMLRNSNELKLYLIDPKQVEFIPFRGFPQVVKVVDDMSEANALLEKIVDEMEDRYTKFKEVGVKSISGYNQKFPNNKIPYIVVAIDEYADLKMVNSKVDDLIVRLGQKARQCGIHLIVATQRPSVDVIEGKTKANLPSRISLKLDSGASYTTILDGKPSIEPTGRGHGVMQLLGQIKQFEQFQSPIISINELETEETFEKIKKSIKGEKINVVTPIEKSNKIVPLIDKPKKVDIDPIDRLKRIILDTDETRVAELQKSMGIGINKVSKMMKQLVEEGWLYKHESRNKGYEIIVKKEEVDKWEKECEKKYGEDWK